MEKLRTSDLLFADREFSWEVSPTGHSWINAGERWPGELKPGERLLIGFGPFAEDGPQPRVYNPAKTPDLYRRLAKVAPYERNILEFADQWGNLTRRGKHQILRPQPLHAERLTHWLGTIANLNFAIVIHDWIQAKDERALRGAFTFRRLDNVPGWVYLPPGQRKGTIGIDADHVILTKDSDPALVAKMVLTGWVNQHFSYGGHVVPLTHVQPGDESIVLRVMPLSLEGLVWWQLAQAMQGQTDYQLCAQCQKPIRVGAGRGARTDTRFCSTKCKQRYHEDRGKEARRLRAAGTSLHEIAKQLDTKLKTVKRWLTPRKRKDKP